MSNSEFTLVDHEISLAKLQASMKRVGAQMPPDQFVRAVSNAYHEVEANRHAIDMHAYFRGSGGYKVFKEALIAARSSIPGPVSILNVGCGAGYDLEVLREVFPNEAVRKVVCCDISADMLSLARERANGYPCRFLLSQADEALVYGPFDLVVTHAMIKHVPDLKAFFQTVEEAIVPGGGLVTGHEPNKRYWANPECMQVFQKVRLSLRRSRYRKKLVDPSRYLFRVARLVGMADDVSLESKVNSILRERAGLKGDLTPQEIRRLVDVHVPDWFSGNFKIGLDGFDWEMLQKEFLRKFEMPWVGTSGYLGPTVSPVDMSKYWQQVNAELAARYPLDGSNFSAFWRKRNQ